MKRKMLVKIPLYIGVLAILILYGYPLFYLLNTSLKSSSEFIMNPIGLVKDIRLMNYVDAWQEAKLGTTIFNSFFYTVVCTFLSINMAVFLSYPVSRNYFKLCSLVYLVFMMGMFLPDGTIPKWRIIFNAGLYNTRLGYILTMIGGGGVTLLMFVSYIKSIPKDLDEAAVVDGCGYIRFVYTILMPLMKPAIVSMTVLSAVNVWNDIINAILYLSDDELYPITRGLYVFRGDYHVDWSMLTSALVVVAIPMIILYIFLQKHIINGIVAGGVKA